MLLRPAGARPGSGSGRGGGSCLDSAIAPRPTRSTSDAGPCRRSAPAPDRRPLVVVGNPPTPAVRARCATPGSPGPARRQPAPRAASRRGPDPAGDADGAHRRGDLRAGAVTVRICGLSGCRPPAHPRGPGGRCGRCRRSSRASTCRRGWSGSASSTAGRRCACAGRARSSTRCASTCAATTSAPSSWRASARNRSVVVAHRLRRVGHVGPRPGQHPGRRRHARLPGPRGHEDGQRGRPRGKIWKSAGAREGRLRRHPRGRTGERQRARGSSSCATRAGRSPRSPSRSRARASRSTRAACRSSRPTRWSG